jgi:hypothetical protein
MPDQALFEGTIDFVSGHVQESKCGFFFRVQSLPVAAHLLQQIESADHVGLDKRIGR